MNDALDVLVAIDVAGGRVVRLARGDMSQSTEYHQDPVAMAVQWEKAGAEWLHIVDLDAATGAGENAALIERMLGAVGIRVEVGGGIRTIESIGRWLSRGAARVCVGTRSMDQDFLALATKEFGEGVVASLDARNGEVQVSGWLEGSGLSVSEACRRFVECGVSRLMFTDISTDGMLSGPNIAAIEEVLGLVDIPVIASGGVAEARDVEQLAALAPRTPEGVVIGRALYEKTLSLEDALAAAGNS